ncbi:hypothetical protein [Aquipuribacter nitratireducens]|uniref:Uncharacterized protein n=1 Tax=Aquipuribacter nitratireducens TaxID=650104 RepID=A0ABW0GNY0_9MICO
MSAFPDERPLHRGRLVLGVLMVVLAALALLESAGVATLQLRFLAPGLLVLAGLVLLVPSIGRGGAGR